MVLRIPSDRAAQASIVVVADDAGDQLGTIGECDEENNRHDTGLFLNQAPTVEAGPDRTDLASERRRCRSRPRSRTTACRSAPA